MFENPFRNHNLDASPICPVSAKKYDPLSYRIFKAREDFRMVHRERGITPFHRGNLKPLGPLSDQTLRG